MRGVVEILFSVFKVAQNTTLQSLWGIIWAVSAKIPPSVDYSKDVCTNTFRRQMRNHFCWTFVNGIGTEYVELELEEKSRVDTFHRQTFKVHTVAVSAPAFAFEIQNIGPQ